MATEVFTARSTGIPVYVPGKPKADEAGFFVCPYELWVDSASELEDDLAAIIARDLPSVETLTHGSPLGDLDRILAVHVAIVAGVPSNVIGKADPESEFASIRASVRGSRGGQFYKEARARSYAVLDLICSLDHSVIP